MFNDYLHFINFIHDIVFVYTDILFDRCMCPLRAHLVYYLTSALLSALRGILEKTVDTDVLCVSSSFSFQDVDDILK